MFAGERWKSLRWKDNLKIVQVEWSQLGATRVHHKNQLFTPNLIRLLNKTGQTDTCHTMPVAILELAKWFLLPVVGIPDCRTLEINLLLCHFPEFDRCTSARLFSASFRKKWVASEMAEANKQVSESFQGRAWNCLVAVKVWPKLMFTHSFCRHRALKSNFLRCRRIGRGRWCQVKLAN